MHSLKYILFSLLILVAGTTLRANNKDNVDPAPASGGTGDTDNTTNGDGGDFSKEAKEDDTTDDKGQNCSVVYQMNVGSLQSEQGGEDVHLRIKRLKPTPLMFTPQSLHFNSPVVSDVFAAPVAAEAQAVAAAGAALAVAQDEGDAAAIDEAEQALALTESNYSTFISNQQSAGVLVNNAAGLAVGELEIERANGLTIGYKPEPTTGTWVPTGRDLYYGSRIKSIGSGSLVRTDGKGFEYAFAAATPGTTATIKEPSGRTFSAISPGVRQEVLRDGDMLRQVCTPQALSDIVVLDEYSYEVRLYKPADMGSKNAAGFFEPTGTPIAKFKVENPTRDVNELGHVRITTTKGNKTRVRDWEYSEGAKAWDFTDGTGQSEVSVKKTITRVSPEEEKYQWVFTGSDNQVVETRNETIKEFAWGSMVTSKVIDPGGINLEQTFTYYDQVSDGKKYGKQRTQVNDDGSWIARDYDSLGREMVMIEPWLDSPVGSSAAQAKATYYDYTPVDSLDSSLSYDRRIRTETVKILDQITKKTFYAYYTNANNEYIEIEEVAGTPSSAYGDSGNLRTTKTHYPDSDPETSAGRLKTMEFPNGQLKTYTYERLTDNTFITTVTNGVIEAPAGIANKTTRVATTLSPKGNGIRRELYIYNGSSYELAETIEQDFDERGQVTERRNNGRVTYTAIYENALKVSGTNEQGITMLYTYDSRDRVTTRTKLGVSGQSDIVTTFSYDAKDRVIEKEVSAGVLSLTEAWEYDGAGRLSSYTDQAGYVTAYTYANDGRIMTKTNPNASIIVRERYLDGQIKSRAGSGVVGQYYAYTVLANGSTETQVTTGRSDASRISSTTQDSVGRIAEQSRAGFGGVDVERTFVYDDNTFLVKNTETELADTLYVHDSARQMIQSGLDLSLDGNLTPASSDRVSEEESYYWKDTTGDWWLVTQQRTYADTGSAVATLAREKRVRVNGFDSNEASETVTLDTQGNETTVSTVINRSTVTMTVTVEVPRSTLDGVATYVNGLLLTRTTPSVSEPTVFTYDDLARKLSEKNPRHTAAAEWDYDATTGLLIAQRDADGNSRTYTYHPDGQLGARQVASITDALSQVGYRSYNLLGQLVRIWGETEYPVEYSFNEFGERTSMSTFRTGDGQTLWTGSTWPETPSTADVTTWTYDEATGLLTTKTDAKGKGVTYSYTTAGRMTERLWARLDGQSNPLETTYSYDALTGERTLVDYADNTPDVGYSYDRIGRIDTVTDAAGSRSFTYNTDLQIESETIATFYGTNKRLTRTYETGTPGTEVVGRYLGFSVGVAADPDQDYTVGYAFDANGRMDGVTDRNSTYDYTFVADSNLLLSMASPEHTSTYSYETNRDLKETVQNDTYATYAYRYDDIGRRTDRVQSGSAFTQASFDDFSYNTRSEVIGSDRYESSDPTDISTPVAADVFAYQFDSIGNRISATESGVSESYSANELNQYDSVGSVTFIHDDDGNITNDGTWILAWTAENRLKSVEPVVLVTDAQKIEFEYDYLGRRIQKTVSEWDGTAYTVVSDEKFLYDGWNLVAVYDAADSNALLKSHTWGLDMSLTIQGVAGIGGLLGVEELSGTHSGVYHFAFDANGNVTEVLDDAGSIAAHYEYDPFGNVIHSNGTYADANTWRFSTKYTDSETGFVYYGLRYYSPGLGRWLKRDLIGELGGLNLYNMVFNNSVNSTDYLGMVVFDLCFDFSGELEAKLEADEDGGSGYLEIEGALTNENGDIIFTVEADATATFTADGTLNIDASITAGILVTGGDGPLSFEAGSSATVNSDGTWVQTNEFTATLDGPITADVGVIQENTPTGSTLDVNVGVGGTLEGLGIDGGTWQATGTFDQNGFKGAEASATIKF